MGTAAPRHPGGHAGRMCALSPRPGGPNLQGMNLIILLLVLALIFGGVGLFVTGLKWLLIVSAALFVASLVSGTVNRGRLRA